MSYIAHEKKVVSLMIGIYCKKMHKCSELCPQCQSLEAYAHKRLTLCPYQEKKSFCAYCPTQCYSQENKQKIIEVMRFSRKYMMIYHFNLSIKHLIISLIHKKRMKDRL